MIYLKKLLFGILFLISFTYFCAQISFLINSSTNLIFSLSTETIAQLLVVSGVVLLTSIFFVVFVTLAEDIRFILVASLLSAGVTYFFMQNSVGIGLGVGFFISLMLSYLVLKNKLVSYVHFSAASLLSPDIKNLAKMLVLVLSIGYFATVYTEINKNGFSVPDSLIEAALKFSGAPGSGETQVKGVKYLAQGISLSPQQIQLLKQHPELLKQYGISPEQLDQLSAPSSGSTPISPGVNLNTPSDNGFNLADSSLAKGLIKDQLNAVLKPYVKYIPIFLAALFFLTFYSTLSIIGILVPLLVWFIFYTLEKTKFIKFDLETRQIKKLVV